MSTIPSGTELSRDDVIGRKLIAIVQSGETNEGGIDWVYTFFRLDSGATFCLPFEDAGGFLTEDPNPDSTCQDHPDVQPVLGHRIVAVLRLGPDADFCHDSPFLLMENGYVVTDVMGDFHGTGNAGLHVYPPREMDTSTMLDFFD